MSIKLITLGTFALNASLALGLYIVLSYGPECGMVDTLLGFCGN